MYSVSAAALGLLALGLASTPAFASTANGTLNVTATIATNCTVSTTPVVFGNYTGAVTDASGTVSVSCTTSGQSVTFSLGAGNGTVAQRQMTATGGFTLNYNLYTTTGYGTVWGDGTGSSATQTALTTGTGTASFTAYGQIPAQSVTAPNGTSFADTVTATVTY
ncbi:MAG: spore coat protein U domain-containing protein [Terracidiphilus sp.]